MGRLYYAILSIVLLLSRGCDLVDNGNEQGVVAAGPPVHHHKLVLFFKATSTFQLKQVSLTKSTKSVQVLDSRNVLLDVAGNDSNVVPTTQRQRAAINDHVVSTRQTFLAKALIASTLTSFSVVSNADTAEFAGKFDC